VTTSGQGALINLQQIGQIRPNTACGFPVFVSYAPLLCGITEGTMPTKEDINS
ncbi:MAG: hypothetical protein ACD_24C00300G0001, partial [uncultured bacterium]